MRQIGSVPCEEPGRQPTVLVDRYSLCVVGAMWPARGDLGEMRRRKIDFL
jgi:hypothetical protein